MSYRDACEKPLLVHGNPGPSDSNERPTVLACGNLDEAKNAFMQQHADNYGYQGWIEQHWHHELGARLGPGQHYLDYTGAGQYTTSMIQAVMQELTSSAFGNPHSRNPSSSRSTQEVSKARAQVLQHFNADPDEYYVVFTKGATEGLKMVGEFFPWHSGQHTGGSCCSRPLNNNHKCKESSSSTGTRSSYIYTQANHKSVLGIGAYAKQAGASLYCLNREQMHDWLAAPKEALPQTAAAEAPCCRQHGNGNFSSSHSHGGSQNSNSSSTSTCHLVAYPAKDNYEGQLYPLEWIEQVHTKSDSSNHYFVVLDAAAHAATHNLDLSQIKPDFVPLSFYKLFGYPSGLGALIVRREAARHLNKVYFGGGSVDYCTAEDVWHVLSAPPAGLEDGTLGYLNISALKHGFALLNCLGGMQAIDAHVNSLRVWTYQQLLQLKHSNGRPLLKLFGRHQDGSTQQSGIFQFQVLTPEGERLPGALVEAAATAAGLHIRTGCNCNPGVCLPNLGIRPEEERARAAAGHQGPVLVVMRPRQSTAGEANSRRSTTPGRKSMPGGALTAASADIASAGGSLLTRQHSWGSKQPVLPAAGSLTRPIAMSAVTKAAAAVGTTIPAVPATAVMEAAAAAVEHKAPAASKHLVPVKLPLGSVRASLGALSTFEDCYNLVRFLVTSFKDFVVYERDLEAGVKMIDVVNDGARVVKMRATVSSAGALEQNAQLPAVTSAGDVALSSNKAACVSKLPAC